MFRSRFGKTAVAVLAASVVSAVLVVGCSDDSNPAGGGGDDGGNAAIHEVMRGFATDLAEVNNAKFADGTPSLLRAAQSQTLSPEEQMLMDYMLGVIDLTQLNMLISGFIERGIAEYNGDGIGTVMIEDFGDGEIDETYTYLEFRINGDKIEGKALQKLLEKRDAYGDSEEQLALRFTATYDNGLKEFVIFGGERTIYDDGSEGDAHYYEASMDASGNFSLKHSDSGFDYSHILPMFNELANLEERCDIDLSRAGSAAMAVVMGVMETLYELYADFFAWYWET